jgi:hypothetical protein
MVDESKLTRRGFDDGLAHVRDCGASRVCATPIGDDEIS